MYCHDSYNMYCYYFAKLLYLNSIMLMSKIKFRGKIYFMLKAWDHVLYLCTDESFTLS